MDSISDLEEEIEAEGAAVAKVLSQNTCCLTGPPRRPEWIDTSIPEERHRKEKMGNSSQISPNCKANFMRT